MGKSLEGSSRKGAMGKWGLSVEKKEGRKGERKG